VTKLRESRPIFPVRIGSKKISSQKPATVAGNDFPKTVPAIFKERVRQTPCAVVYEEAGLSCRDLNKRSNRLAHYLAGGPKDVCINRPAAGIQRQGLCQSCRSAKRARIHGRG
jgi:non-ribosomal peptide synthetase component F